MASVIHHALLLLVLVHAMHAHGKDFIKRDPSDHVDRPNDYKLQFYNNYHPRKFIYNNKPLQLRCYAVLYDTKKPVTVKMAYMELSLGEKSNLTFYVRPGAFRNGWRIQCDYRYLEANSKALKGGIVLTSGPYASRCLRRNQGCQIVFADGEARRVSNHGQEFLGDLYEKDKFLFGQPCPGRCGFPYSRIGN